MLADAARTAFVEALSGASLVVAAAVAVGALVVWRHLPAGTQVEAVPSAATS